jgi:hypothetical protein
MNTRRHPVVRFAASAVIAAALTLGAHAFVPSAYGCGTQGGGNCRSTTTTQTGVWDFLSRVQLLIEAAEVLLP